MDYTGPILTQVELWVTTADISSSQIGIYNLNDADPEGCVVSGVDLWPLDYRDREMESAKGREFRLLCLFCVGGVATSAASWSLVYRIPTGCVSNFAWSRNLK